mmetsp:Transcript_42697/g.129703  ORF Transcript_42697/g.129703 Transcript_42697/m.129703 type:complete len:104 (+) Transcript_42697:3011-3322(+)
MDTASAASARSMAGEDGASPPPDLLRPDDSWGLTLAIDGPDDPRGGVDIAGSMPGGGGVPAAFGPSCSVLIEVKVFSRDEWVGLLVFDYAFDLLGRQNLDRLG